MTELERINYFNGKLLTEDDFRDEQQYNLEKLRLHNRFLHGCGVAQGLNGSLRGNVVHIDPGVALDCVGNEIIIFESTVLTLPKGGDGIYLTIKHQECFVNPIPVPIQATETTVGSKPSRIREGFELDCERTDPWSGHNRDKSGWLPCGKAHAIPLVKLKYEAGQWRQLRFHPPHLRQYNV